MREVRMLGYHIISHWEMGGVSGAVGHAAPLERHDALEVSTGRKLWLHRTDGIRAGCL